MAYRKAVIVSRFVGLSPRCNSAARKEAGEISISVALEETMQWKASDGILKSKAEGIIAGVFAKCGA